MFKLGPIISYAEMMSAVSELELAEKYIPGFNKVNKSFRLRSCKEDTKPSCRVFPYGGNLFIKDFGDSKATKARSIFQFIKDEYHKTESEAINMIVQDFNIDNSRILNFEGRSKKKQEKDYIDKGTTINVKYRDWNDDDLEYWGQYGITTLRLEASGVFPISYFWVDSKRVSNKMFRAEKWAYTYDYYNKDSIFRRKIYQPRSKWLKWLSNCSLDVVQNYRILPKQGELLVIQSSLKDSLVMNSYGYNSIAPISESTWFTDDYYSKILSRFNKIIYFANNDWDKEENNGLLYGQKIQEEYNIPIIYLEDKYKCSDISDFRATYGHIETENVLKRLINGKL